MNFVPIPDKASTDVFTDTMWDDIRNNIINLQRPPMARKANNGVQQTVATGINFTTVTMATTTFDTDEMADTANVLTIKTPGLYACSAWAQYQANATGDLRGLYLPTGLSGQYMRMERDPAVALLFLSPTLAISGIDEYLAGNYLVTQFNQDSGGNLVIYYAAMSAVWIGRSS